MVLLRRLLPLCALGKGLEEVLLPRRLLPLCTFEMLAGLGVRQLSLSMLLKSPPS